MLDNKLTIRIDHGDRVYHMGTEYEVPKQLLPHAIQLIVDTIINDIKESAKK